MEDGRNNRCHTSTQYCRFEETPQPSTPQDEMPLPRVSPGWVSNRSKHGRSTAFLCPLPGLDPSHWDHFSLASTSNLAASCARCLLPGKGLAPSLLEAPPHPLPIKFPSTTADTVSAQWQFVPHFFSATSALKQQGLCKALAAARAHT